jgi:2-polyprenyl-3-methyl-5-hydroxy-6-metoxy-1,4-benzoquinol methylase
MRRIESNSVDAFRCLICAPQTAVGQGFARIRGWNYVRCWGCGLVYLDPKPSTDELTHFYNSAYHYDCESYRKSAAAAERWLKPLAEFCGEPQTILEIGCSYGFFLGAARRQGWKVAGVELGEYAAKYAREELHLPVRTGTLFDVPQEYSGSFDAVVAWHVLEHEPDPLGLLKRAHVLLRPGGIIGLRVPNMESLVARLAGPQWQWLSPPEHIYLFSDHTLGRLLTKAGFEIVLKDSAPGPAHNMWFEIVRARTKQRLMRQANGKGDSTEKGGLDRPRIYEDKWWYRLGHRAFEVSALPVDFVLSPWLSRRTLEAELIMFARKIDAPLPSGSSRREAGLHRTV